MECSESVPKLSLNLHFVRSVFGRNGHPQHTQNDNSFGCLQTSVSSGSEKYPFLLGNRRVFWHGKMRPYFVGQQLFIGPFRVICKLQLQTTNPSFVWPFRFDAFLTKSHWQLLRSGHSYCFHFRLIPV